MIFRKKYTDAQIIKGLKAENKEVRIFEGYLYDFFINLIRHGQKRYFLSESDSLDCYVDAYTAVVKTIKNGNFEAKRKIAPLFKTIFDRKCVDLIRKITNNKRKGTDALDDVKEMSSEAKSALEMVITSDFMAKIKPLLQTLGENCRSIIHLWSHSYAHKEIADVLPNVSNAASSKSILAKCLKKLRKKVFVINN